MELWVRIRGKQKVTRQIIQTGPFRPCNAKKLKNKGKYQAAGNTNEPRAGKVIFLRLTREPINFFP
jgi:hypothetical protein